jgi:hypothetical protein
MLTTSTKTVCFLAISLSLLLRWHHDLPLLLTNNHADEISSPPPPSTKVSAEPSQRTTFEALKSGTASSRQVNQYRGDEQLVALYDNNNNTFHGVKARSFDYWHEKEHRCFPPRPPERQRKNYKNGFLYLKPLKTGSSTAAGVTLRLARNEAHRRNASFAMCDALYEHSYGHKSVPNRNITSSFLWSTVRDPIARHVSSFFYFEVTGQNVKPTDENFIHFIRQKTIRKGICSHYLERLSTKKYNQDDISSDAIEFANSIFDDFNFIGVTERMDESLVALSMLLSVPLGDVLYLSSKTSGAFGSTHEGCQFLQKSFVTPGMQEFFQTSEFQDCAKIDHIVHQVANRR